MTIKDFMHPLHLVLLSTKFYFYGIWDQVKSLINLIAVNASSRGHISWLLAKGSGI